MNLEDIVKSVEKEDRTFYLEKFHRELLNRSKLRRTFINKIILQGEVYTLDCASGEEICYVKENGSELEFITTISNKIFTPEFWISNFTNEFISSDKAIQELVAKENALLEMIETEAKKLNFSFPLKGMMGTRIPVEVLEVPDDEEWQKKAEGLKYLYGEFVSIAIWKNNKGE